eukprot:49653_1
MKRRLPNVDYLSSFYETKQNLESAHKRQRIFAHPTSKNKLLRQHMYQFIENHNSNIDTQINDEITKLVNILRNVIIDNNIPKMQELVSHGILDEINNSINSYNNNDSNDMNEIKNVVTEILGCILQYNREECLLIISPFIKCKKFDINKFDKPILSDPYKIILFLHSNGYIDLTAAHAKLFHKCVQYGHYNTVKYCLDSNVQVNSCENRAIRDAARYGHLNVVKLLHSRGGNIHQYRDECLRKAARHGHINVLKYLISNNGNIHSRNSQALLKSVENGHTQCVDLLIKNGILKYENLCITNNAIKYRQYNCLSLLLRYGYTLYDEKLRRLALIALYGNNYTNNNNNISYEISDNNDNYNEESDDIDLDILSEKNRNNFSETESSVSPPLSPQYLSSSAGSIMSMSMSDRSPSIGIYGYGYDDQLFEDDDDTIQRFLDSISEGLALRETMMVSVLTEFIYDEIACIICSYEKLACTDEDKLALNDIQINKGNKFKRTFSV